MMKYSKKEIFTFSNFLSLVRLLLAVPLWILLDNFQSESTRYLILTVCLLAALTDIFDGYFARKNNQITEVGKIIDPLADKIGIGAVIIKLFLIGQIPLYYFLMIIGRDILIFLGGIIVTQKLNRVLPSNILGKSAVIVIGIVIILILLNINKNGLLFISFYYLSIFLIFTSLIGYIIRAKEFIKKKNHGTI